MTKKISQNAHFFQNSRKHCLRMRLRAKEFECKLLPVSSFYEARAPRTLPASSWVEKKGSGVLFLHWSRFPGAAPRLQRRG
jgi:hypothetical protein